MGFEYVIFILILNISLLIPFGLYSVVYSGNSLSLGGLELEKISSYECGFHPFDDTRDKFNIRFYLVSILFIIFDIEIILLFPLINYYSTFNTILIGLYTDKSEFFIVFFFLLIIILGFIYEWLKGALIWE